MKRNCWTVFCIISIMQFTQAQAWVHPDVNTAFQKENQVPVFIEMEQRADISLAPQIIQKVQKGTYVYQQLLKAARISQQEILNYCQQEDIPFRSFFIVNGIRAAVSQPQLRMIQKMGGVKSIYFDGPIHVQEPIDPQWNTGELRNGAPEWGIVNIKADQVWALGHTGQGVTVGGADTGYDWEHPAIQSKYRGYNTSGSDHNYNWHDAIHTINPLNGDSIPDPSKNPCGVDSKVPCDDNSHGTHTMGTMVGSDGGNQIGVAPNANWCACRNMERGWGSPSSYIECFEWFIAPTDLNNQNPNPAKAPHVINNSWGCWEIEGCNTSNFPVMEQVVANVKAAGIVVVVSAGNAGSACHTINDPAAIYEPSFSIGAIRQNDTIAGFSSRGTVTVDSSNRMKPNVAAPGVGVRSCVPNGNYANFSGTSMAGPHVAGTVALVISANPSLAGQVEKIETIIESTAIPMFHNQDCGAGKGTDHPNAIYGWGRIDALAAVQKAINTSTQYPNQQQNLILFPNPVVQDLWLDLTDVQKIVQIQWIDATGHQIQMDGGGIEEGQLSHVQLPVDLHGVFFVVISTLNKTYTGKVVKL